MRTNWHELAHTHTKNHLKPFCFRKNRVFLAYVALGSDPLRRSPHYVGKYSWLTFVVSLLFQRINRKKVGRHSVATQAERCWMLPARCCVNPCPCPARAPVRYHGLVPGASGPRRGRPPPQPEALVCCTAVYEAAAGEGTHEPLEESWPRAHHGPDGRGRPCPAAVSWDNEGSALQYRLPFVRRFRAHPR